ncbi:MAG: T9SS type A sorting domain-containing protein [Crocinitomicaceae bacterium]
MKKTLLTLGIFTFTALASFGQSMKITDLGGSTDISGTTHQENPTSSAFIAIDFEVYNENATTDDFIITRVVMAQPNGWENQVCWGSAGAGLCYPNNPAMNWSTPNAVSLAPGDYGSLTVHVIPTTNYNQYALYRYYCGTVANPKQDSIDVVVNQSLTVKEVKKDFSLSVAPNPATENVNIKVSNFEKGNLKIVDVLGNVVFAENFFGSKSVNVADFRNGVYFIIITGDGVNTINRKLVVKH